MGEGSTAKATCSFCPAEATPAEGTGQAEAGARGARSAVHHRVRALVLLVLLVLVCYCPCPLDKDNDRQGQEEQEAQEPAPFGAPRFERRERRPPRVLSPRPESPQRGKKNKGPRHCCPEKLRRPRYPVSAARREQLLTTRSRRAFVRNTPVGDTAPWHKGRTGGVVLGVALLGVVVDRAVLLLPLRRMASRIWGRQRRWPRGASAGGRSRGGRQRRWSRGAAAAVKGGRRRRADKLLAIKAQSTLASVACQGMAQINF